MEPPKGLVSRQETDKLLGIIKEMGKSRHTDDGIKTLLRVVYRKGQQRCFTTLEAQEIYARQRAYKHIIETKKELEFTRKVQARLLEARELSELSVTEVFEKTGIPTVRIRQLEGGVDTPKYEELLMLAEAYGVEVGRLTMEEPIGGGDRQDAK